MDMNLLASAGNMASIPGSGRFTRKEHLSPCALTTDLSAATTEARETNHHNKPKHHNKE